MPSTIILCAIVTLSLCITLGSSLGFTGQNHALQCTLPLATLQIWWAYYHGALWPMWPTLRLMVLLVSTKSALPSFHDIVYISAIAFLCLCGSLHLVYKQTYITLILHPDA